VEADVALAVMAVATTRCSAPDGVKNSAPADTTHYGAARSSAADAAQNHLKTFYRVADGDPAAPYGAPVDSATGTTAAVGIAPVTIVAHAVVISPGGIVAIVAIVAPPLEWGGSPFDIGIHLDLNAPGIPLCHMDSDDDTGSSSSDADSIFFFSRD
jgi:hypothetical protein